MRKCRKILLFLFLLQLFTALLIFNARSKVAKQVGCRELVSLLINLLLRKLSDYSTWQFEIYSTQGFYFSNKATSQGICQGPLHQFGINAARTLET